MSLDSLEIARATGNEPCHAAGVKLGFDVLSFWRWAYSDLCANAQRGIVAEFLVAQAVGATREVRTEWDAYDVVASNGLKIEVKTSAYLQTWKQTKLCAVTFDIGLKRGWDAATNTMAPTPTRSADLYVFALHAHQDKTTLDALDLSQWEFYLLPATVLNERCPTQKTIKLSSLARLGPTKVAFAGLGAAIARAVP